jgi:hypothetical protein
MKYILLIFLSVILYLIVNNRSLFRDTVKEPKHFISSYRPDLTLSQKLNEIDFQEKNLNRQYYLYICILCVLIFIIFYKAVYAKNTD